ncbi:hypothetical protein BGZ57DRAFT_847857 [Hyaloscypha finlandica]|nr:hypothetical protein BGZ57DRAFT_847857 [Hyaloscypha finlandica]
MALPHKFHPPARYLISYILPYHGSPSDDSRNWDKSLNKYLNCSSNRSPQHNLHPHPRLPLCLFLAPQPSSSSKSEFSSTTQAWHPSEKPRTADLRENFNSTFNANITSVAAVTNTFLSLLHLSPNPKAINISSGCASLTQFLNGKLPPTAVVAYSVSKAAQRKYISKGVTSTMKS